MGKKKVTLSLDSKVYDDFKEYCDRNAIMLSKKIELVIKEIMKGKFLWAFFLAVLLIQMVSGAVIYSDGFEEDLLLQQWNVTTKVGANPWTVPGTDPHSGFWHAQAQPLSTDEPATVMQKNISTFGHGNINFSYHRKLIGLDVADEFQVEWFNGTDWIVVEQTGGGSANDASYVFKSFLLDDSAGNNDFFQIKFECTAGAVSEFCRVDDITITGDVAASPDVTPPSVFLESPGDSSNVSTSVNYFAANFSDDVGLANVTLYVWNTTSLVGTNFSVLTGLDDVVNLSFDLPHEGVYHWNYLARDNSSNSAWASTNFSLTYEVPVVFSLIINSPSVGITEELTPNLNVSVTGNNVDSVWFSLNDGRNITYAHRNGTIDFAYLDAVFIDDFGSYANESDGSPTWENLPSFKTAVIEDGRYKLYNETPIIDALASINNFSQFNYGGSAKVMVPTGYFGGAYLTPRFGGVNWKYEIALDYDWSSININKVVDGVWTGLDALWTGDKGIFVSKNQWHELGFEIKGDNITAFVDGVEMISVLDSELNDTGFALIAYDFEDQHMAYFDDLELHKELGYGYHTLRVYANNTDGNVSYQEVDFVVDSPQPQISIVHPESTGYGFVVAELNYSIFDLNLSSCWYSLDSGITNTSIACGENVTGAISSEGNNIWTVWANDTSGNVNYSSVGFFVDSINPEAEIIYPLAANYSFDVFDLNYSFVESNPDSCWYSTDGGVINISIICGENVSGLGASQGDNVWSVWVNDTLGKINVSSVSFFVDSVLPIVVIDSPQNVTYFTSAIDLNFSILEDNLDSCWYDLNGAGNVSLTDCGNTIISASEGSNSLLLWANDTLGNVNFSGVVFGYEILNYPPNVSLNLPLNGSAIYEGGVILNASVFDDNGDNMSVWFYGDGVSLNRTENVSDGLILHSWSSLSGGWHYWSVVVGDGEENTTSETRWFYINLTTPTGTLPEIEIAYPSYVSTYGNRSNVSLNFSVNGENLDSCWYSLDDGATNLSIANCVNTTFSVASDGLYNLGLYANESVEGLIGEERVVFFVVDNKPTIHLLVPDHDSYSNYSELQFRYAPFYDESLVCGLLGDFSGNYSLNQTNDTIVVGENWFYVYNLTEGNYSWAISCNSSSGDYSSTGNRTLVSDYTAPNVTTISQPSGEQTSGELEFVYAVNDTSPTTCVFEITTTSSGSVAYSLSSPCDNVVINYNVNLPSGDYQSSFAAEDAAGNAQIITQVFYVVGGAPPIQNDGGGGGGGGAFIIYANASIQILGNEKIFMEKGTSKFFNLGILNNGGRFLNNCKLIFGDVAGAWMKNNQSKGLSLGEKFDYQISVSVPNDLEPEVYQADIAVECEETRQTTNVDIEVYQNIFDAEIIDYRKDGVELIVEYSLTENSGSDHDLQFDYEFVDMDGFVRYSNSGKVFLGAKETRREFIKFELPKDSFGEFTFNVVFKEGDTEVAASKDLFLPSQTGLTGLAISDANKRTLSYLGVVVLVLVVLAFIVGMIRSFKRNVKKAEVLKSAHFNRKKQKKLMELEL